MAAVQEQLGLKLESRKAMLDVLVVDRAGWHTSKRLALPAGLELRYLPAYTQELNPAERLWPLVVGTYRPYETYQRRTARQIPLVVLERR